MAQGNCVECLAEGTVRTTALMLDGEFVCATHAAKIREAAARFRADEDEEPAERPAAPPARVPGPPPPGSCEYCRMPRHRGMCQERIAAQKRVKDDAVRRGYEGRALIDEAAPVTLPAPVPATEIQIEPEAGPTLVPKPPSDPAPARPQPQPLRPAATAALVDEIQLVPLEKVPELRASAQDRLDRIYRAVLDAPEGKAVQVQCADKKSARTTVKNLQRKLLRADLPYHSRVIDSTVWLWRRPAQPSAAQRRSA